MFSVCPHLGGSTRARSSRGVPKPGPAGGGIPRCGGYPKGGYPNRGYPNKGTPPQVPPSDLARGTPLGVPHLQYPHQTWPGGRGTPMGGASPWVPPIRPGRGSTPGGTPPWVHPIRPGWGVPQWRGIPPSST